MHKEKLVLYVVIAFLAGFVLGAAAGIRFYASQHQPSVTGGLQGPGQGAPPASQAHMREEIERIEAALKKEPDNLQALIALGNAYFDMNRYEDAMDAYRRALKLDPKNPDVRTDLGTMYRARGDYDRAIREYRQAAGIDPNHTNSRYNLGVVLEYDKKDIPGAIAAWEEFLKVEPSGQRADQARGELQKLKELKG